MAVDPATVDVRHFSLYPWNGARVLRLAGILALHVAALWAATLVLITARGALAAAVAARSATRLVLLAALGAADACRGPGGVEVRLAAARSSACCCRRWPAALRRCSARRIVVWYRHATIAARIFGLFVAFLVPAVLLYPSLNFFAEPRHRAADHAPTPSRRRIIRRRCSSGWIEAQREIDASRGPARLLVAEPATRPAAPDPKNAFYVWSQTVFGRARLTSAVELYNRERRASQPLRAEPARIHRQRTAAAGRSVLSVGRLRRAAADWLAEAARAPRRTRHLCRRRPGCSGRARSSCTSPSTTTARCRSSRRRARTSSCSARARGPARARPHPATTCTSPSTVGGSSRSTRRRCPRGRSPSAVRAHLRSGAAAVLGPDSRSARTRSTSTSPTIALGIYAIGYPQLTLFDHLVHLAEVSTLAGAAFVFVMLSDRGLHPAGPRAAARRPRAAARDSRQLLSQAVSRVRARVDYSRCWCSRSSSARTSPTCSRKDIQAEAARTAVRRAARHRRVGRAAQPRRGRRRCRSTMT